MLKTISEKKALEFAKAIVSKEMGEISPDIGFSSNIFMLFGLPTRRHKEPFYTKNNGTYEFTLSVTSPKNEIPWGCYARLNQIFIDSEIVTNKTNLIELGDSFNEYVNKINYKEGRANKALKKQLVNLLSTAIKIEVVRSTFDAGLQTLIGHKWAISLDEKSPDQRDFFKSQILINADYANYVSKHAVPLDMSVIRFFKRNPLALDFYRFLAYRNNKLEKGICFPDKYLFDQFGTEQKKDKVTRQRLKKILKKIQNHWPVKAKFEDELFYLDPSPPAVQAKLPAKKNLTIITELSHPLFKTVDN